jgi:cysteine desulfurase
MHWFGQQARQALEEAREQVARLLGAGPAEIVFTASGTEADNMALRGATSPPNLRRKIVVTAIEHHAVLHMARCLADEGYTVETVRVLPGGRIDLDDLRARVDENTALVSLMLANNETGVVQPVAEAAAHARAKGALVHCDAVQAAGKIPIDVQTLGADLLTISAHKLYGPKGVGALYVKRGTPMRAFVHGGSQERNRRAGTENVAGIVGLGRAAALARETLPEDGPRLADLRDRFEARLLAIEGARRNGEGQRVPNTSNLSFDGIDAESLLLALDLVGVAVSTGAACSAGGVEPSHVLRAMGVPFTFAHGSVRFSLSRYNTEGEIDVVVRELPKIIDRLRSISPFTEGDHEMPACTC